MQGSKLIMPNADYSEIAVSLSDFLFPVELEKGGLNIIPGNASFGEKTSATPRRIRPVCSKPVYIPNGAKVVFYGLRKSDNTNGLLIDGIQYDSDTISHAAAEHNLSGDVVDDYFTLNSQKNNEFTWVNNLGDGYFQFCFAENPVTSGAASIDIESYSVYCSLELNN
jgi:hypothetical protein